jgi:uncharacterized RDD family membrane protein YckC
MPAYGSPYQPYPGTGYQYQAKDPSLAEWWRRLLARLIDWVIVGAVILAIWIPSFISLIHRVQNVNNQYINDPNSPAAHAALSHAVNQSFGSFYLITLVGLVIAMAYDWVQHALWGQTVGKRALGTRVVTADTRSKIGAGAAAGRAAVYAFPPIIPFVGWLFTLLNELWLLWDQRRQCLHDKAASTVVVKTRGPAAWPGPYAATMPAQQQAPNQPGPNQPGPNQPGLS